VSAADDNGLGLFDDTASAVGNFPTSLRGYDRTAVDDYVRTLEASVVQSRRHAAALEQQVTALQDQLRDAGRGGEVDYAGVGGRANDILRLAQEQARDMVEKATVEAAKLKESARREADSVRQHAAREGDTMKTGGMAELDHLRAKLHEDIQGQVEKAKAEAEALIAAARRQADSVRREAEHEAQTIRQNAHLDTEKLRRSVEKELADGRQQIAVEREAATGQLRGIHDDANQKTAAMLAEATKHHEESARRLEADMAEAARVRSEALAEAEQLKQAALKESEERLSTAKRQAAAINERTQQEFAWRKQQLRRETELLHERKKAVLNQLASLSALAQETAHSFPDLEDPSDLENESDHTVLRPENLSPSLPADQGQGGKAGTPNGAAKGEAKAAGKAEGKAGEENVDVDGEATLLAAASDKPAGTQHLQKNAGEPKKG
jgi:hypothetical protein